MQILSAIESRFSPMHFEAEKTIAEEAIELIFEAGRWAPSSFNEQPWRYIHASRSDQEDFANILSVLIEYNQQWASSASLLVLVVASEKMALDGKTNAHAWYDTGLSVAQMVLQASSMGIQAHQMGGFDAAAARKTFDIPEGFSPVAVVAFGYPAPLEKVPEQFRERANEPRVRKSLRESVFEGKFTR